MGVRVRLSRNTSAYVPFWAATLFWLIVGPVILAVYLLYGIIWLTVAIVTAIREARRDGSDA